MQNHLNSFTAPETQEAEPVEALRPWQAEVSRLLTAAAALCVEQGIDVDNFMRAAWSVYIESRPGMREQLEEAHLREQLEQIRQAGRMAEA
ncbi:MAG: hypothetical protein E6J90_38195 [Deltaproteobacteria bacterium]|nr:MAG: hypothetical protein E6J91_40160 [Deltaproteobacteria bacterium]TMQ09372.1 MAG: hypothetical protein E6J90_38195 [Deltaproteobacteria bacterium]